VITGLTGRVDLIHGTNFVLPALGGTPGVVTIHDLSFLRSDVFPGGKRLTDLVPWSIDRAALVLTPTAAVGDEVRDHFRLSGDRLRVTPEGVAGIFFGATPLGEAALASLGVTRPFAVAVGTIEPRKNLDRLLSAWAEARLDGWTLVIAGPEGWGPQLPETPGVVAAGWVADESLPGLLAAAEIFCYPSLYEGFGLPPLEAMAAGTPALVGRYPAADEVLKDACLLVDPTDVEAIAGGLTRLATDAILRRRFAASGKARAAAFTWERTAQATLEAYEIAVGT
jgi:glycosyltransferase involved in cell wall biosynthesis